MYVRSQLLLGLLLIIFAGRLGIAAEPRVYKTSLASAPSPADNPLKGLVPYASADVERFPHSLEFFYIAFNQLVVGPGEYDWKELDQQLDLVASRGCQSVLRVWIEYPGQDSGMPKYLLNQGVKVTHWINDQESPPSRQSTPDYENPKLIAAIEEFIRAFGLRYDGDPRIGYVTAGLIGAWGEWHTWPRDELFASPAVQSRILSAYESAFKKTPILLRYPVGEATDSKASNANRAFGFHDDSFAWATLETGEPDDSWFYMTILREAGNAAQRKWESLPIGGEIRPEIWGEIFDASPKNPKAQDFAECVRQTHVTWLMDSGMFRRQSKERVLRAKQEVQKMGYDFWIQASMVEVDASGKETLTIAVLNQGVAPWYADWPVEIGVLNEAGEIVDTFSPDWNLKGILPSKKPIKLQAQLPVSTSFASGKILLRVVNPLPNGKVLRFANASQDADKEGWVTLYSPKSK